MNTCSHDFTLDRVTHSMVVLDRSLLLVPEMIFTWNRNGEHKQVISTDYYSHQQCQDYIYVKGEYRIFQRSKVDISHVITCLAHRRYPHAGYLGNTLLSHIQRVVCSCGQAWEVQFSSGKLGTNCNDFHRNASSLRVRCMHLISWEGVEPFMLYSGLFAEKWLWYRVYLTNFAKYSARKTEMK